MRSLFLTVLMILMSIRCDAGATWPISFTDSAEFIFIDAATNNTIPGVIVMAQWEEGGPGFIEKRQNIYKRSFFMTDLAGAVRIPSHFSFHLITSLRSVVLMIYHPYYLTRYVPYYENGMKIIPAAKVPGIEFKDNGSLVISLMSFESKYPGTLPSGMTKDLYSEIRESSRYYELCDSSDKKQIKQSRKIWLKPDLIANKDSAEAFWRKLEGKFHK